MSKSEKQEQWAAERVQYIRGLKSPNEQQKLMLILTDKADKTAQDIKTLSLLMKAEQAAEKAQEARAKVMNHGSLAAANRGVAEYELSE